jgi:hypothetical protein
MAEARRHLAAVETALAGVPLEARALGELRSLLGFLVRRDVRAGHTRRIRRRIHRSGIEFNQSTPSHLPPVTRRPAGDS